MKITHKLRRNLLQEQLALESWKVGSKMKFGAQVENRFLLLVLIVLAEWQDCTSTYSLGRESMMLALLCV